MNLIYIENDYYLKRIIYLHKRSEIPFTTDFNDNYSNLIVAEVSDKVLNIVKRSSKKGKKVVFLFHLEEARFCYYHTKNAKSSESYNNKLYDILKYASEIIVSLPYFKDVLSQKIVKNISVIPRVNPMVNSINKRGLYKKYNLKRNKRRILVIDNNYKYLEWIYKLAIKKSSFDFIYITYTPKYSLTNKKRQLLNNLPDNIKLEIEYPSDTFFELLELSSMVIYLSDLNNYNYLVISLLKKKILFIKNFFAFESYLINSKNCYIFDSIDQLNLKMDKILANRIANLSNNGYDLIKNNTYSQIVYMLQKYFK